MHALPAGSAYSSINRRIIEHEVSVIAAAKELPESVEDSATQAQGGKSAKIFNGAALPRRAIPCKANHDAKFELFDAVSESLLARKNSGLIDETGATSIVDSFHSGYEARDTRRPCWNCGHVLIGEKKVHNSLHKLFYGTCVINAVALKFTMCTKWNYFDGDDAAMLSYIKRNVFYRDLLE